MSEFKEPTIKKSLKGKEPIKDPNAWMDEPLKSNGWINYVFTKQGVLWKDENVFSTQEEAAAYMMPIINTSERFYNKRTNETLFYKEDYSHCIQMPVK